MKKKFLLILGILTALCCIPIPSKTVNASETHVHTASCYPSGAALHSSHGAECYGKATTTVTCGGVWAKTDETKTVTAYATDYVWYCTNRNCSHYLSLQEVKDYGYGEELATIYKVDGYTYRPDWHNDTVRCPSGHICTKTAPGGSCYKDTPVQITLTKLKCTKCGAEVWEYMDWQYENSRRYYLKEHASKEVQTDALICTRDLGKWYIKNADGTYTEARPICGTEGHVHTNDCYAGTAHLMHSVDDGCYSSASKEVYCSGWYQNVEVLEGHGTLTEKYYYCSKCGGYTSYYSASFSCSYGTFTYTEGDRYCDCTGKNTTAYCRPETIKNNDSYQTIYLVKCSACGETRYVCDNYLGDVHLYDTHGRHTETQSILTCTRELGKRYIKNADGTYTEGGCVCNKTITSLVPSKTQYTISPGSLLRIPARAVFLDGHTEDIYLTYETGTGEGKLNPNLLGVYQTVRAVASSVSYPYSNTGQNRTPKAITVEIMIASKFGLTCTVDDNGTIIVNPESSDGYSAGDTVTIKVIPNNGYHVKEFSEVGITNESTESKIVENVISPSDFKNGNAAGTKDVSANGVITYTFTMPTRDVSVKAFFVANEYSITFDPNGGRWDDGSAFKTGTIKYLQAYSFIKGYPTNPARSGYIFAGWYSAASGGEKISLIQNHASNSDITFYAHWTKAIAEETVSQEYDSTVYYPLPIFVEGFATDTETFWRLDEEFGNGTGIHLVKGGSVKLLESRAYYGHWDANVYTLTFEANGGIFDKAEVESISDASSDGHADYISPTKAQKDVRFHTAYASLPVPIKSGSTFMGWEITGTGVTPHEYMEFAEDLTLSAVWFNGEIPKPSEGAFPIENLTLRDMGGNYDPTEKIPSTETIIISGRISPWDFMFQTTSLGGITKISAMTVYKAVDISWQARNSDGRSCFDVSDTTTVDIGSSLELYKTSDLGVTVYTTSDYSDDEGVGVKVIRYSDPAKSDEIYVNGVKADFSEEMLPASSVDFSIVKDLIPTIANDKYRLSHTTTYEHVLSE